jgi:hypothetical protein
MVRATANRGCVLHASSGQRSVDQNDREATRSLSQLIGPSVLAHLGAGYQSSCRDMLERFT